MYLVCLSVHALTFVNIHQMSWNWCIVIYIRYSVDCTENGRHITNSSSTEAQKTFPMHCGLWEENVWNVFLHIYIALNIMKLTYVIQGNKIQGSLLKNDLNSINI